MPSRLFLASIFASMALPLSVTAAVAADQTVEVSSARAESIGFRLATSGVAYCPRLIPLTGLLFQILDQFTPRDRPAMIAAYRLDHGPRIVAVAAGSPGAAAGLMPDDIILTVNGQPLWGTVRPYAPFDQTASLAALDTVETRVAAATSTAPARLTILRAGRELTLPLASVAGCPLRLHVARSNQRNAFADGVHLLVPTGLMGWIADDNQLALVIAHEMAHNILGHAAAMRLVTRGADRRALLRDQEDAADLLGAKLVRDAGYDLLAASKVFLLSIRGIDLFPSHGNARERARVTLAQAGVRDQEAPRR